MSSRILLAALLGASGALAAAADPGGALMDPTRPDGSVATAPSTLSLDSVVYGTGRKLAIVNGRALAVGDHIGEATVQRIGRDFVELVQGGRVQRIGLKGADIKQKAEAAR